MELVVCHSSAAQNLEVGSRFLENFWTPVYSVQKCYLPFKQLQGSKNTDYHYFLLPGGARKRQGAAGSKTTP